MNFLCQILLNEMAPLSKSLVSVRSIIVLIFNKEEKVALCETVTRILFLSNSYFKKNLISIFNIFEVIKKENGKSGQIDGSILRQSLPGFEDFVSI